MQIKLSEPQAIGTPPYQQILQQISLVFSLLCTNYQPSNNVNMHTN